MTALFQIENVKKRFTLQAGTVTAVNGVNLNVVEGETFGIVGESGCGKSTLARMLLGLTKPTDGRILYRGQDIQTRGGLALLRREVQCVFQDPFTSLSPRMKVWEIIAEPIIAQGIGKKRALQDRVAELLELTGLPQDSGDKYPHQFSGGQRQRIAIARALALTPKCIILDEPVSALDVSIRAHIINLLCDLQQQLGLTYVLIAHDLAVMQHMCDRIAVMYLGQAVEFADRDRLYDHPSHPYTRALLDAVLTPQVGIRRAPQPLGDLPSPLAPPPGCPFSSRCPVTIEPCNRRPPLIPIANEHSVACHHFTAPSPTI